MEMAFSHVVGYQQKEIKSNFNWWCNTFVPCSKSVDAITLGDISVDPSEFISSSIDFVDDTGATIVLDHPELGSVPDSYVYWTADDSAAGVAGWYLFADDNAEYPCNDRVVKLGEAYIVSCNPGEEGSLVTYSGVVNAEDRTFEIASNFNWLGNCTPVDIKLGDITVDPTEFISSSIDFVDDTGATIVLQDPNLGPVPASYVYWTAEDSMAGVEGWYLFADDNAEYPCNDLVIKAGDAFIVSCNPGEEGSSFTIPSAL